MRPPTSMLTGLCAAALLSTAAAAGGLMKGTKPNVLVLFADGNRTCHTAVLADLLPCFTDSAGAPAWRG